MTSFQVEGSSFTVTDDNNLIISGSLASTRQLDGVKAAAEQIEKLLIPTKQFSIDVVECEDCVSLLLKPVLLMFSRVVPGKDTVKMRVASLDGYLLPWHQTLHQCVLDFKSPETQVTLESVEI